MATLATKLFLILMGLVVVNAFTPLEKLHSLKAKGVAAVGKVKHAVNAYKVNTQAKLHNMKSYLNYLTNWAYAKAFPYKAKPLLDHHVYNGFYNYPGYYYYGQPYSYVQYYSPGAYEANLLY